MEIVLFFIGIWVLSKLFGGSDEKKKKRRRRNPRTDERYFYDGVWYKSFQDYLNSSK